MTILYPAVISLIVAALVMALVANVVRAADLPGALRRLTAAVVPFVAVVLAMAINNRPIQSIAEELSTRPVAVQLLLGVLLGGLLVEFSRRYGHVDSDRTAGLYALPVAALAASLLWAVGAGVLSSFDTTLLGVVAGAGLDVVLRSPTPSPRAI